MWEIFIDLSLNISQRKRYFLQWSESPRNCAKKVFHGLLNAGESSFCTVMLQGVLLLRRILAHCSQSHGMAPGFPCSMLLPPLKSWVLRGTVRIKLLAWEGKRSNPALARTQVSHSGVQRAINTWPPRLTTAKQFIIHRGLKGCKLLKKILIKKCQFFSHNGSQLMVNAPVQYSAWICLFNIKTTVTWLNLLSNMLEVAKIQKWKINILLQRLSESAVSTGTAGLMHILIFSYYHGERVILSVEVVMPDQLTVMSRWLTEIVSWSSESWSSFPHGDSNFFLIPQ